MESLGIGEKYANFLVANINSRHVIIQGSRRSGKSFAIYKWLRLLASGKNKETILVVTATYPALQNAIQDFQSATGLMVDGSQIYGYNAKLPNGSMFMFKAFDDYTKAQGTGCTRLFVEESLNVSEDIITTLSMSAKKQIYFAYNPTKTSHLDKYISPDKSNFLKTTYKDNPHLPKEQVEEFEEIERQAKKPNATQLQKYSYQVYVLGEFSSMAGKVFKEIFTITDEEYEDIHATEYFGLDFGFVDNSDQTALVGVKILGDEAYLRQYIYDNTLAKDYALAIRLRDIGITPYDTIFCDWGGMGKSRLTALTTAGNGEWVEEGINRGFSCTNAVKGGIVDGLNRMLQYKLFVTDSSYNLREQMDTYELDYNGKPKRQEDHLIDAARYAVNSARYMI